ncbi:MAG: DUF2752 domain-containing protein [Nocardioidaceae bacterium]|nr:DUF2752 domain-containing protein [Nocardioidaceae bacterium]
MTLAAAERAATESRWRRVRAPLGTAAGLALASAALRFRDPHQSGSWGFCPFKAMTGLDCPFCGGLRGVNDLTHGRVVDAWHSNALFVSLLPVIAGAWLAWLGARWSGRASSPSTRTTNTVTLVLLVLSVGFGIYRNTPWGEAFRVS